jgi:hypothetical protein
MTKVLIALVFVQHIAKIGKLHVQPYKTLAMGALQNPYVNQELRTQIKYIVPMNRHRMVAIFRVKL